jgi:hypothetical protein
MAVTLHDPLLRRPDGSGLHTSFQPADEVGHDDGIRAPEVPHVDPA